MMPPRHSPASRLRRAALALGPLLAAGCVPSMTLSAEEIGGFDALAHADQAEAFAVRVCGCAAAVVDDVDGQCAGR